MTEQAPTYDELSIRIQSGSAGRYQVVASAPDGATASGSFALPFSETELDNFVLRVGRQRMSVRGYRSAQMAKAKQFGTQLFDALMVDEVRDVFRTARGVAESHSRGLRVTLYLTDVPELMGVPWEFLYERPGFLAQSMYSPVVRSLDLGAVRPPQPVVLPLRVLGMVSRPEGVAALDVDREKEKLASALAPLSERQLVRLEWLECGTLSELDEALSRDEVHVFHYIGHGAYDTRTEGGILVLENEQGGPHEVSGEELGSLLQDERSLRLAVLNSCEGARSSHVDPFSGVASSLVQYGIPAVIGMQFEITDGAAITFASRLYTSLAQGYPVDAALAQARRSIFAAGNDIEFGTPVLFLRGADAHLFDLENPAPAELEEVAVEPAPAGAEAWSATQPESFGSAPQQMLPPVQVPPPPPEPMPAQETYAPPPVAQPPVPQPLGIGDQIAHWIGWNFGGLLRRFADRKRRVSTRRLVIVSGVLILVGAILAAAAGTDSPENGTREAGNIIATLGFIGFWWLTLRICIDWVMRRVRRFLD
jgi:CHAT domain